jgi:hypothetical protein
MAAISWNPSSFGFPIFPSYFPRISIGLACELHGEILGEGRMIGRQARPCMNLFVMYRWFGVVLQGLDEWFPFVLFGDFRSLFLAIFLEWFRGLSLWDLVGGVCMTPSWFFSFDSPPKSVSKGARFCGFLGSGFKALLVEFLDSSWFSKFWWTKS